MDKEPAAILDYTLLRRGAHVGPDGALVGADEAKLPEAGYVIGRLFLAGVLSRRQHDAALRFGIAWRRWASLAGVAPHVLTQREQSARPDVTPTAWRKAKEAFYGASYAVLQGVHRVEVWRLLEMLVMDDAFPVGWRDGMEFSPAVRERLRSALTRLGDHYGMPDDSNSAKWRKTAA